MQAVVHCNSRAAYLLSGRAYYFSVLSGFKCIITLFWGSLWLSFTFSQFSSISNVVPLVLVLMCACLAFLVTSGIHSLCFISNAVNEGLVAHFSRFHSRCLALLSRCLFSSKNRLVLLLIFFDVVIVYFFKPINKEIGTCNQIYMVPIMIFMTKFQMCYIFVAKYLLLLRLVVKLPSFCCLVISLMLLSVCRFKSQSY